MEGGGKGRVVNGRALSQSGRSKKDGQCDCLFARSSEYISSGQGTNRESPATGPKSASAVSAPTIPSFWNPLAIFGRPLSSCCHSLFLSPSRTSHHHITIFVIVIVRYCSRSRSRPRRRPSSVCRVLRAPSVRDRPCRSHPHAVARPRARPRSRARRTVRSTDTRDTRARSSPVPRLHIPPHFSHRQLAHTRDDAPLGSLVTRSRCRSSQSSSRQTPPPGTSYRHTCSPPFRAVNRVSPRWSTVCLRGFRSGIRTGALLSEHRGATAVPSTPATHVPYVYPSSRLTSDRKSGYAESGESYWYLVLASSRDATYAFQPVPCSLHNKTVSRTSAIDDRPQSPAAHGRNSPLQSETCRANAVR